jgi:phosphoglycerol transferase MdoB-like AlkP superfamily enzyme
MRRSVFVPAALLGLIFVIAKIAMIWPSHPTHHVTELLAVTAEDVAIALFFGILSAAVIKLTDAKPQAGKWAWRAILSSGCLASFYAIVSIGVFHYLHQALNARMLTLVGRATNMKSSIAAQFDPILGASLLLVPVAFVLLSNWRRIVPKRGVQLTLTALACVWFVTGWGFLASTDPSSWKRRVSASPSRVFVSSLFTYFLMDRRAEIDAKFPPEYLDDFKLAVERSRPPLKQFEKPPKNVIVVVLESTGAIYTSLCGAPYDTTPNLVRESQHALVFDRFYAHIGYTFCSMMPITFSVYPGLPWSFRPTGHRPMPRAMASVLRSRGYRTAYFSAADPEWEGMNYMARQAGMEEVFGPNELGGPKASSWGTEDGVMIDGLLKWIDQDHSKPFYCVAWTDQTHHPYTLEKDTKPIDFIDANSVENGEMMNRYLNAIHQIDRHLGRLFDTLREKGLADDTLVVVTGDHGEGFGGPHGVVGHGGGIYEENIHVPLMLWNPRLFPKGQRIDRVGGHVDLNPTVAHIIGIDPPADWQGASLFSPDHPDRAYLLTDMSGYQFGVVDDQHKYIMFLSDGYERLFDLKRDPKELRDISIESPEVASQLRSRVSAFVHAEDQYLKTKPPKR